MTQIYLEIPDELISHLEQHSGSVQEIIIKAIENYVHTKSPDITKTRPWELCGSLEIDQADPQYIIGQDQQGQIITNYAENIDQILY